MNSTLPKTKSPERVLYEAAAHVVGGRTGSGRTSDGALDVDLTRPREMGGEGGGTNPEQLFAVGWAACFLGALGVAGLQARVDVSDASIASRVALLKREDGSYSIAAELDVQMPALAGEADAHALVRRAHELCAYSNATRGNIAVAIAVNGQALD